MELCDKMWLETQRKCFGHVHLSMFGEKRYCIKKKETDDGDDALGLLCCCDPRAVVKIHGMMNSTKYQKILAVRKNLLLMVFSISRFKPN